jgi:hypothetical protein
MAISEKNFLHFWRHFSHKNPLYELHWKNNLLPSGQNSQKEKNQCGAGI